MRYEGKDEKLKDQSKCAGVRADLKICLLESDCCKIDKKTPKECMRINDPSISEECKALRNVLFECKRSLLDGRRRFRGPKGY
ncbi:hypothetical protein HCN44_006065 [Aphidius gifuensis]|uniref:Cytochrome c oxidase assembly factor 5 n=1 Tax=Aphidius gifuensis TaxID=684658 RepID=A0A834Y5C7_APHGI|nr:cytochrome c oxidase assembly factor 5 [Aphidius gifuensis]XP_044006705.1 cytochrome c oxidase assembly factor 5 [Aphidius gifuensis]XP_044006713.1 cytochrome c oxidase assembly factor 5 [Aphidius gifuensis]KAF7997494.1 hypothetical protein HCN44_006065 [Aphidius gifuensis]